MPPYRPIPGVHPLFLHLLNAAAGTPGQAIPGGRKPPTGLWGPGLGRPPKRTYSPFRL